VPSVSTVGEGRGFFAALGEKKNSDQDIVDLGSAASHELRRGRNWSCGEQTEGVAGLVVRRSTQEKNRPKLSDGKK